MGAQTSQTEVDESLPTIEDLRKKLIETMHEKNNNIRELTEEECNLIVKIKTMRKDLSSEEKEQNLTEKEKNILKKVVPILKDWKWLMDLKRDCGVE